MRRRGKYRRLSEADWLEIAESDPRCADTREVTTAIGRRALR